MSITREELIAEVAEGYDTYRANKDVLSQMGGIDITVVTGPTGAGKNTLMNATGLPIVIGETIREPRLNNGVLEQNGVEYEFRSDDLGGVIADYRAGNYVQIGMGPSRNSFYASRIANYPPSGTALKDLMTNQVDSMRQLPFGTVEAVHITALSYGLWIDRLNRRGQMSEVDYASRVAEAITSITDALDDERYTFILNDNLDRAAVALRSFALTRERVARSHKRARECAATLLKALIR